MSKFSLLKRTPSGPKGGMCQSQLPRCIANLLALSIYYFIIPMHKCPTVNIGTKVFGVSLDQLVEQKGSAIPDVVYQAVKCIEKGITYCLLTTAYPHYSSFHTP
jgi:hypothetical protein